MKPIKSFAPSVPQCDIWDWAISSADCSERCQKTGQNAFRETTLCERMGALPLNLGHCIIAKEFTRRERRQVKEVEKKNWKVLLEKDPPTSSSNSVYTILLIGTRGRDFRWLQDGPSAYLPCLSRKSSIMGQIGTYELLGLFSDITITTRAFFSITEV